MQRPTRRGAGWKRMSDAYLIATILPFAIVIGYGLGRGLDSLTGWYPWGTVVLSALGVAAGFKEVISIALRVGREEDAAMRGGAGRPRQDR